LIPKNRNRRAGKKKVRSQRAQPKAWQEKKDCHPATTEKGKERRLGGREVGCGEQKETGCPQCNPTGEGAAVAEIPTEKKVAVASPVSIQKKKAQEEPTESRSRNHDH